MRACAYTWYSSNPKTAARHCTALSKLDCMARPHCVVLHCIVGKGAARGGGRGWAMIHVDPWAGAGARGGGGGFRISKPRSTIQSTITDQVE